MLRVGWPLLRHKSETVLRLSSQHWYSPAAERNKEPILRVLRQVLPDTGLVLEIASGTGQHIKHFAQALPKLTWQPSEADSRLCGVISQMLAEDQLANIKTPIELDVMQQPWPISSAAAILNFNMIHISPWTATEALLEGTGKVLTSNGMLILYGPYKRFGQHTAPSNERFDTSLKAQNPHWGVRDLEEVKKLAETNGLKFTELFEMPSNNFCVIFHKH